MSREVRRVPLDWKHPVTYNEHWRFQASTGWGRSRPLSRLHGRTERFVGLHDDYPGAVARWEQDMRDARERTGHSWTFNVRYHLTGYKGRADAAPGVHPWWTFADDGETEISMTVRDEDHLQELMLARVSAERPREGDYMPVWPEPDELGWCLYETVSEGTPTTPVFATAEELIEHLATVGQDYDQVPMRREAAETLVRQGHSFGSMVVVGGRVLDSSNDADIVATQFGGAS